MTDERAWAGRVFIGASLDGFIARRDGDIAWLTDPPATREHAHITSSAQAVTWETFYPAVDHLVMGRGTYEKVLTFGSWPYEGKRVIVLSTTLATGDDRVTLARSLDDVAGLLEQAREVYVDGGQVIQAFLRAGWIDELTIGWAPVLIGQGLPLFGAIGRDIPLTLVASHADESGMLHATYRVEAVSAGSSSTGPSLGRSA